MKAAREEVQRILNESDQTADPNDPRLKLTREQLDNMPVLGTMTVMHRQKVEVN